MGSFFCSFCQFSLYLTISLSVFTLLGITMERYKCIITHLASRNIQMTLLKSLAIIGVNIVSSLNKTNLAIVECTISHVCAYA